MNNTVQIKSGQSARNEILAGARQLESIVSSTLGPGGRNVLLKHLQEQIPQSTKDGVTVARFVDLDNEWHDTGCQLLKQASMRTALNAGDGTTSTVVYAYNLMEALNRRLSEDPTQDVHEMRQELESARDLMIEALKRDNFSFRSSSLDDIYNVAYISTNGDKQISTLVRQAYEKFGQNYGTIMIEPSTTSDTTIEVQQGMKLMSGYESYYFVSDTSKMIAELDHPAVIITDFKIDRGAEILRWLSQINEEYKSVLIIAENITGEAMSTLVANHVQNKMKICLVCPTFFGQHRRDHLQLLASATGAKPFYADSGQRVSDFNLSYVGHCDTAIITKDETTLTLSSDCLSALNAETEKIKAQLTETLQRLPEESDEVQWKRQLLAYAQGNVAKIKVGGRSQTEIYERRDRIEDAVSAVRSSLEEGLSVGAGSTYIRLVSVVPDTNKMKREILHAAVSVKRKLCENLSFSDGDIATIIDSETSLTHYDCHTSIYLLKDRSMSSMGDPVMLGIVDPAKVIRNCIENAISVATMFLLTDNIALKIETPLI